jgi:hypothetical protein
MLFSVGLRIAAMSWTSEIDTVRRLIRTRVSGLLSSEGAVAHRAELAADPRFDPTFCHFLDLREVDQIDLTAEEIMNLASRSVLSSPARQAIIATTDIMYGLARMYEAYREQHPHHEQIAVCRTLDEASAQLGVDLI